MTNNYPDDPPHLLGRHLTTSKAFPYREISFKSYLSLALQCCNAASTRINSQKRRKVFCLTQIAKDLHILLKSLSTMQVKDLIINLPRRRRMMPFETIIKRCACWGNKLTRYSADRVKNCLCDRMLRNQSENMNDM